MGYYLNLGSKSFQMSLQSPLYVDKTSLIEVVSQSLGTGGRYLL